MRHIFAGLACAGLLIGLSAGAQAQDSMNAFGAYPAGITTGSPSPYGIYSQGTYGFNTGYPFTYSNQSFPYYGSNYLAPGSTFYNSGYAGGYYGPTHVPQTYSSYYGAPAYGYGTYSYPTYTYRRGLFGRRYRGW